MRKFKLNKVLLLTLPVMFSGAVLAADNDADLLEQRVNQRVQKIEQTGFLPTSVEIEAIAGDIVDEEVKTTDLTAAQAAEKYQLTPTLTRYIKIKETSREIGAGDIDVLPPPPPPDH
jgi:hypothetical protein